MVGKVSQPIYAATCLVGGLLITLLASSLDKGTIDSTPDRFRGYGFAVLLVLVPMVWLIPVLYGYYTSSQVDKRSAAITTALTDLARTEPRWQESHLVEIAQQTFTTLKSAWQIPDLTLIQQHVTPGLFTYWQENILSQTTIHSKAQTLEKIRLVDVQHFEGNTSDQFTAAFDLSTLGEMVAEHGQVRKTMRTFREFWTFEWDMIKQEWLLSKITT